MYAVLTNLVEYTSYDFEPSKTWALRDDLKKSMEKLTPLITRKVHELHSMPDPTGDTTASSIHTYGETFAKRLLIAGTNINVTAEILMGNASSVLATVGVVVCSQPYPIIQILTKNQFAQIIDFYLKSENKSHWDQIIVHAKSGTPGDDSKLAKYILEAARLTTTTALVRHAKPADGHPIELVVDTEGTKVTLNPGDRVIINGVYAPP